MLIFSFKKFHKVMPYSFPLPKCATEFVHFRHVLSQLCCLPQCQREDVPRKRQFPSVGQRTPRGHGRIPRGEVWHHLPEIPQLFLACDDAPRADIPSPSVIPPPDAPLVQAPPTTIVMERMKNQLKAQTRLAHICRCDSQTKPENAHCHVRSMK